MVTSGPLTHSLHTMSICLAEPSIPRIEAIRSTIIVYLYYGWCRDETTAFAFAFCGCSHSAIPMHILRSLGCMFSILQISESTSGVCTERITRHHDSTRHHDYWELCHEWSPSSGVQEISFRFPTMTSIIAIIDTLSGTATSWKALKCILGYSPKLALNYYIVLRK